MSVKKGHGKNFWIVSGVFNVIIPSAIASRSLITSRPHVEVESNLLDVITIPLDNSNLKEDIADFAITKVSKLAQFPIALQEEIQQALINGADGIFLWVSLIIDDLQKSTTTRPRIIREKLKSLPKSLPGLYNDILRNIKTED
jgi:hypothetical protein